MMAKSNLKGTNDLEVTFQPKQEALLHLILNEDYEWIGYGGARGGSKSHAVRNIALTIGLKMNIPVLIFRRFREELLHNHCYPMMKENPWLRNYFNKQELIIYHPDTGLPMIKFGYAERVDDIYKFQGQEYPVIFIDEATQSTQDMIEFLSTCNRDPQEQFLPKMILTMNPGGVSHPFIKRIFIDRIYLHNENPKSYIFIQASVWDNWYWVKKQLGLDSVTMAQYYGWSEEKRKDYCLNFSNYAKKLASLPEDMKLAHLFGDWNVFAGMFFKKFNVKTQVIEPFIIPEGWRLFGSLDPGYSAPCSYSIRAVDFDFNVYRIATYYERERSAPQHAEAVRKWMDNLHITRKRIPERIVADPAAWQKREKFAAAESERTFADHFEDQGIHLERGVNDRITGWWNMKDFMERKNKDGTHKYFVFDEYNKPFIDQILSTMSDDKQVEDISGRGNDPDVPDHAIDEERYALMMIREAIPLEGSDLPDWYEEEFGTPDEETTVMSI